MLLEIARWNVACNEDCREEWLLPVATRYFKKTLKSMVGFLSWLSPTWSKWVFDQPAKQRTWLRVVHLPNSKSQCLFASPPVNTKFGNTCALQLSIQSEAPQLELVPSLWRSSFGHGRQVPLRMNTGAYIRQCYLFAKLGRRIRHPPATVNDHFSGPNSRAFMAHFICKVLGFSNRQQ